MRYLFILLIGGFLISCQQDGCTDPTATNYDPNADNNDGSCQYGNSNPTVGPGGNCLDGVFNLNIPYGNVTDIDGNNYRTVQIGNQNWMAENLRVTHYQNGDPIPNITDGIQWTNLNSGAWIYFRNDSTNNCSEGKLYNFYAVTDSRKICPQGWHIPTSSEWHELLQFVDPNYNIPPSNTWGSVAADYKSLLSVGTNQNPTFETSWIDLTTNDTFYVESTLMTNTTGLSIVSSGHYYRGPFDTQHSFTNNRVNAPLWSSSTHSTSWSGGNGIYLSFNGHNSTYTYGFNRLSDGKACRCVQN